MTPQETFKLNQLLSLRSALQDQQISCRTAIQERCGLKVSRLYEAPVEHRELFAAHQIAIHSIRITDEEIENHLKLMARTDIAEVIATFVLPEETK